jgi:hypothetical protein
MGIWRWKMKDAGRGMMEFEVGIQTLPREV